MAFYRADRPEYIIPSLRISLRWLSLSIETNNKTNLHRDPNSNSKIEYPNHIQKPKTKETQEIIFRKVPITFSARTICERIKSETSEKQER